MSREPYSNIDLNILEYLSNYPCGTIKNILSTLNRRATRFTQEEVQQSLDNLVQTEIILNDSKKEGNVYKINPKCKITYIEGKIRINFGKLKIGILQKFGIRK